MDPSPFKRRRTSPTTSVAIDAPTTPSRTPLRKDATQPLSGRPSFASPTKASLSKHHPQLLRRPSSAGVGAERPGSRGRDMQDLFARALGEPRQSIEGNEPPLAQAVDSTTPQGSAHRRTLSDGGGLSAKPRRMSRSPFKQTPKKFEPTQQQIDAVEEMQENIVNPFVKRGLRRSPPAGSQETAVLQDLQENINPFEKRGLRRSPLSSQAVDAAGEILGRIETVPEVPIPAADIFPSKAAQAASAPLQSPVPAPLQAQEVTTQSTEQISADILDQFEGTGTQFLSKIAEQPDPSGAQPAINPEKHRQRHLEESSRPAVRSPKAVEHKRLSRRRPEEPELPPTPTQLGIPDPVVTTPPTGIHDTLSKRAGKRSQKVQSSPLKRRDPPPPARSEPEPQPESKKVQDVNRRRSSRFLVAEDPHASKKQTRDDLLQELQQLQADVAVGKQENDRLRLESGSRKLRPTASSNTDELLAMLLRATAPESAPQPKQKPKSIFKSIDSFLPFTSRRKRQSTSQPTLEKPIPSHLPITVDDPLPYLQVFSPLTYTSNTTLLPPEPISPDTSVQETEQLILQHHLIKASHPSGLFSARLSMVVDSELLSIVSLDIEALPSNAEKELGTFMRERSKPDALLNRDIGAVCWAMGRWVEMSIQRASFWCNVEEDFGTPEARAKSLQRKVQKQKRRSSVVLDEDDDIGHNGNGNSEVRKKSSTVRQLRPHMGRTAMELSNDEVELRFEWRLGFDWTGEVESSISVSTRLPKSWQNEDDRMSFQQIPGSFDKLVKEKGRLGAVRTVVGLLMPVS